MARTKAQREQIASISQELIQLTSEFCDRYLDAECKELATKLILKMKRKREVPFLYGRTNTWAAAIIYALCQINFLIDRDSESHTTPDEIAAYYCVGRSYVGRKAKTVRDMFRLRPWDPDFSTQEMRDCEPFKDIDMIDGFYVPISMLSPELREELRRHWSS